MEIRATKTHPVKKGKTVSGVAAKYNAETVIGDFVEVIRSGAFTRSLSSNQNIRALYQHQAEAILGTTRANTLRLFDSPEGLKFELDLPDTTVGNDLAVLIERGDVAGCSFGFTVRENGDTWEETDTGLLRELKDVELFEITLTADPAYQDTSVAIRSRELVKNGQNLKFFRLYLDTL